MDFQGGGALGVSVDRVLIATTDTPTLGVTNSVETGSKVNGVFLVIEVYGTSSGALSNVYMMIFKNPGGNLTFPAPNVAGGDDNKKYIIHQEMVMLQKVTPSNPRTLFKGVVAIPRGYRRNGPNDTLTVRLFAPGVNFDFCIQTHYKEFR